MDNNQKALIADKVSELTDVQKNIFTHLVQSGSISWAKQKPARDVQDKIDELKKIQKNGLENPEEIQKKLEKAKAQVTELEEKLSKVSSGDIDPALEELLAWETDYKFD